MFLFYDPLFFFPCISRAFIFCFRLLDNDVRESTKLRGKKGKNVSHGTFQRNIVRPRTMRNPAQNNKNFYE